MVKLAAASQRAVAADPSQFLSGMNAALLGNTQSQFVTAAYVHLDSESGELRYSAAAHPPLLLVRNGCVRQIEENGLMLAAFSFASYSTAVHKLEAGDRIVMYTDGILEASNAGENFFGHESLCGDNVFWKNCQHPAVPVATPIGSSVHRYDQVKLRQNHHKLPSGSVCCIFTIFVPVNREMVDMPAVPVFVIQVFVHYGSGKARMRCG
jgi:phosphoserine phosphatase RsbU/P